MATPELLFDHDEPSPLVRIRSLLPALARAEQRVANIVLAEPGSIARRSITDIAQNAGTSETTVTRFCKAIGVGGYPDLRIALATEAARTTDRDRELGNAIAEDDSIGQIVGKVGYADSTAVQDTVDQLDTHTLTKVVEVVAGARRIDVYGAGASAFVASGLQHKLHRIGLPCFAWSDPHHALGSATLLRPGDVAIGISHTGATMETVEVLREATQHGATTVAITNFARSPITEAAEHVLTTAARETTYRTGAAAGSIAQLTVTDCLFVGVAQRQRDTTGIALRAANQAIQSHRLENRPDRRRQREDER